MFILQFYFAKYLTKCDPSKSWKEVEGEKKGKKESEGE